MEDNLRVDIVSKNFKILQKVDHYSMSTDSFLLPYFANVPKSFKKNIIELCSGNGGISIILREKSDAKIEMLEIQDLLYQLRLSEQASTQLFEKRLGISLTRYQILLFLLENSPCNQMAVQERLKIDQAALTRHFKILEKEGLVERHRNPENQREVLVETTKYAKEQLVVNPPLQHIKVKKAMESILTESERTELSRLLNKLVLGIENIEI